MLIELCLISSHSDSIAHSLTRSEHIIVVRNLEFSNGAVCDRLHMYVYVYVRVHV